MMAWCDKWSAYSGRNKRKKGEKTERDKLDHTNFENLIWTKSLPLHIMVLNLN